MTAAECHEFVNKYYAEPVLETYTACEYDLKHATTPKRLQKLDAKVDAENAKLRSKHSQEIALRNAVHTEIDEVSKYPAEIAELFLSTFKRTVEDIIRRHEAYLAQKKAVLEKFGESIANRIGELKYLIEKKTWQGHGYRTSYIMAVSDEEWEKWTNAYTGYRNEFKVDSLKNSETRSELFREYRTLVELRDNDDISNLGEKDAYSSSIRHIADTLQRIRVDIAAIMQGPPEKCETDPNWGVGGKFNGVLSGKNGKKISFCSFGAGGYNIQRYHFRYKITELK